MEGKGTWWCTPLILALRTLKQEDGEFKFDTRVDYMLKTLSKTKEPEGIAFSQNTQ